MGASGDVLRVGSAATAAGDHGVGVWGLATGESWPMTGIGSEGRGEANAPPCMGLSL